MSKHTPSIGALRAAKAIWPEGAYNTSYCWDDEAQNESDKQEYRDGKAAIIDRETHHDELVSAVGLLLPFAEAAYDVANLTPERQALFNGKPPKFSDCESVKQARSILSKVGGIQ